MRTFYLAIERNEVLVHAKLEWILKTLCWMKEARHKRSCNVSFCRKHPEEVRPEGQKADLWLPGDGERRQQGMSVSLNGYRESSQCDESFETGVEVQHCEHTIQAHERYMWGMVSWTLWEFHLNLKRRAYYEKKHTLSYTWFTIGRYYFIYIYIYIYIFFFFF